VLKHRALRTLGVPIATICIALFGGATAAHAASAPVWDFVLYPNDGGQMSVCSSVAKSPCSDYGHVTVSCIAYCYTSTARFTLTVNDNTSIASPLFHAHNASGGYYSWGDSYGGGATNYTLYCGQVGKGGYGDKDWWVSWNGYNSPDMHPLCP